MQAVCIVYPLSSEVMLPFEKLLKFKALKRYDLELFGIVVASSVAVA